MIVTWIIIWLGTIIQASISTGISLVCAIPVAYITYRFNGIPVKRFLFMLLTLCAALPTKIVALGIERAFDVCGMSAIILAHIYMNIPYAWLILHSALMGMDPQHRLAAYELGATEWLFFKTHIFKMLVPIIKHLAVLIFLLCFSRTTIPILFGTDCSHLTPDAWLYQQTDCSLIMLFLYALCRVSVFVPSYFLLHQTLEIQRTDFSSDSSWPHQHFYSTGDYIAFGFLGIICVFLLWPLFCYVYCAVPQAYLFFLGHDHGMHVPFLTQPLVKIVLNSALIALVSCIGSLIMSALLLIVRMHESSSTKKIWLMTAYAPFLLGSGSICALVAVMHYYFGFSCFVSAIISHTLLHYPIAYRFLASQTSGYRGLTLLAYSIGASRWQVVQTVIIPYAQIASVHAVCLTFCLSFAESGAACFGHETSMMTLPLAIRLCRKHEYQEGVYGLSVLVLIITGFATWVSNKYLLNSKKLRS